MSATPRRTRLTRPKTEFHSANMVPALLTRGGASEAVEGSFRSRVVVIEFKDYATALACYHSPEYAKAKALRTAHSVADVVVVEGYDGPQPSDG